MRIDRRLLILGVMIVVLSTIMATQYVTTKVGYSYTIVHPSDADIRFVGVDNGSWSGGDRILRPDRNGTTTTLTLRLGNWSANTNKTWTAAFAIVNEEPFSVNITEINVTTTGGPTYGDFMQIWLHGNGSLKADDASETTEVMVWDNGSMKGPGADGTFWMLAPGDGDPNTATTDCGWLSTATTNISTPWEGGTTAVRYIPTNFTTGADGCKATAHQIGHGGRTVDNASDFVYVQISINIPAAPDATAAARTGTVWFNFSSSTNWRGALQP